MTIAMLLVDTTQRAAPAGLRAEPLVNTLSAAPQPG
jgi:hypothetical protein